MFRAMLGFALLMCCTLHAEDPPPLGITARAEVTRVIDGDTIQVVVQWPITIRLKDCWAPEIRGEERPEGLKSKEFLESLLAKGQEIIFSVDSSKATKLGDVFTFGRVVGHVWTPKSTDTVSSQMIQAGMATKNKRKN